MKFLSIDSEESTCIAIFVFLFLLHLHRVIKLMNSSKHMTDVMTRKMDTRGSGISVLTSYFSLILKLDIYVSVWNGDIETCIYSISFSLIVIWIERHTESFFMSLLVSYVFLSYTGIAHQSHSQGASLWCGTGLCI